MGVAEEILASVEHPVAESRHADSRSCPADRCPARAPATAEAWRAVTRQPPRSLASGGSLTGHGRTPNALFVVREGCIKSYTVDADGQEHVRAFYFAGDLV